MTKKAIDWTKIMSPRERSEHAKEKNKPAPYQSYTYEQWKALSDPEIKVLKPQSEFERDYHGAFDRMHWSVTKPWKLEEEKECE